MSDHSDSQDKNKREEPVNPNLGDWSPDYFPSSPKTVFKRSLILLLGVGVLCFSVAYCSRHAETSTQPSSQDPQNPMKPEDISDDDTEVF